MRPIAAGIAYGVVAALVVLVANFHFLLLDPAEAPGWVVAAVVEYRPTLALAFHVFWPSSRRGPRVWSRGSHNTARTWCATGPWRRPWSR